MAIKSEAVSFVISEYMKDKIISSNRIVVAPNPEDVAHLLECFLKYVGGKKEQVNGLLDISDITVK